MTCQGCTASIRNANALKFQYLIWSLMFFSGSSAYFFIRMKIIITLTFPRCWAKILSHFLLFFRASDALRQVWRVALVIRILLNPSCASNLIRSSVLLIALIHVSLSNEDLLVFVCLLMSSNYMKYQEKKEIHLL